MSYVQVLQERKRKLLSAPGLKMRWTLSGMVSGCSVQAIGQRYAIIIHFKLPIKTQLRLKISIAIW